MIDVEDKVPLSTISKTNPVDPPTAHLLTSMDFYKDLILTTGVGQLEVQRALGSKA